MKMLNQKKQYAQVLDFFDEHTQEKNIKHLSSSVITQALKASTQLGDLRRGQAIHHLVSSRVKTDCYILSSMIHLYSEFCCFDIDVWFYFFFVEKVQCGDVRAAESLFNESNVRDVVIYGAMMKGEDDECRCQWNEIKFFYS